MVQNIMRKSGNVIKSEVVGKIMDLEEIDDYMVNAGYNSILPADEKLISNSGLIWYPFEPFLNQVNIWVSSIGERYKIMDVTIFTA